MSGVIFTGDNLGYDHYYTINYDDVTGRTDIEHLGIQLTQINRFTFIKQKKKL